MAEPLQEYDINIQDVEKCWEEVEEAVEKWQQTNVEGFEYIPKLDKFALKKEAERFIQV
jgi:hypothetical protein